MTRLSEHAADGRVYRWWSAVAALAIVVLLAAAIPSPYAIERPGPVVDAFGSIETEDGETPVISIEGTRTYPTSGEINVLSVSISGTPEKPANWLKLGLSLFNPSQTIVPLSMLFPEGVTSEERAALNEALMESSQTQATAAALGLLGEPISGELIIAAISEGGPADGVLRVDDRILTAGGASVSAIGDLRAVLAEAGDGGAVVLGIERDGKPLEVTVRPTISSTDATPLIGVSVITELEFPFDVEIQLDRIGGPSAGLTFALALYDMLTPSELTGGLSISTTGTIDDRGHVGAIGGIEQKLWGAAESDTDLFLFPMENCVDMPESIPGRIKVAPVETLEEAITAIETVANGGTPAGIERCTAGVG